MPSEAASVLHQLTEIDALTFQKMKRIMRIVFYFAKKDRAAKEFSSECSLQKMNGADIGNSYQNEISFKILLKYVSDSIQNGIISALSKAEFLSLMSDGSTIKKEHRI